MLEHATGASSRPAPPAKPPLELPDPTRPRLDPRAEPPPLQVPPRGLDLPRPVSPPSTLGRPEETRLPTETQATTQSARGSEVPVPTIGQPLTPRDLGRPEGEEVRRIEEEPRIRPPSRSSPMLDLDDDSGPCEPWEGVQPSRLLKMITDLLALRSPTGEEEAIGRYARRKLRDLPLAWRQPSSPGEDTGLASDIVVDVPGTGPPLLFVAHLDAADPPPLASLERDGTLFRLEGGGAGLHGRAGVAILLEAMLVLCEEAVEVHRPFRAALVTDGDGQCRGARRLDIEGVEAAFCLDGFLADEVLVPEAAAAVRRRPGMSARTARRLAERHLAESPPRPPPPPSEPGGCVAVQAMEGALARVGLPTWYGVMPAEGSAAFVLADRGVPAAIVGTGVTGAGSTDETLALADAVLVVRLLVSLAAAPAPPCEGPGPA